MKTTRAAIWNEKVIFIIIILVSLILLIYFSSDFLRNADYESSITQCSLLFDSVKGKPVYFGEKLDEPQLRLYSGISETCNAKDIEISNSAQRAVELASDCWVKSAKGTEIFGASVENENICMFCGLITTDGDTENFPQMFIDELKDEKYEYLREDSESINLNRFTLYDINNIPELTESNSIMILYFNYQPPEEGFVNSVSTEFSKLVGSLGGYATIANYVLADKSASSISGVVLQSWSTSNLNFDIKENPAVSIEGSTVSCDKLIIPETIH